MKKKSGPVVNPVSVDDIVHRYNISAAQVRDSLERAKLAMKPHTLTFSVVEAGKSRLYRVTRRGVGIITNAQGMFYMYNFQLNDKWRVYNAIVKCDVLSYDLMPKFNNQTQILLRTDSGCETGQVFGDNTCECLDQLQLAMRAITDQGEGIVVNIPNQDGRGMGLPFKLSTLLLQSQLGVNTVESAALLQSNGIIDVRTYGGVVAILMYFGITTNTLISLATNNPYKSHVFVENGFTLGDFKPMVIQPTAHTARHLNAKHNQLGHRLAGTIGGFNEHG